MPPADARPQKSSKVLPNRHGLIAPNGLGLVRGDPFVNHQDTMSVRRCDLRNRKIVPCAFSILLPPRYL